MPSAKDAQPPASSSGGPMARICVAASWSTFGRLAGSEPPENVAPIRCCTLAASVQNWEPPRAAEVADALVVGALEAAESDFAFPEPPQAVSIPAAAAADRPVR